MGSEGDLRTRPGAGANPGMRARAGTDSPRPGGDGGSGGKESGLTGGRVQERTVGWEVI